MEWMKIKELCCVLSDLMCGVLMSAVASSAVRSLTSGEMIPRHIAFTRYARTRNNRLLRLLMDRVWFDPCVVCQVLGGYRGAQTMRTLRSTIDRNC